MKRCSVVVMKRTQAGTNAQASPALVESQQLSRMHPVNATFPLHNPDNPFAASQTLYNNASSFLPQLAAVQPGEYHIAGTPGTCCHHAHAQCPQPLLDAARSHASKIATLASVLLQHACPALPCHVQHQS